MLASPHCPSHQHRDHPWRGVAETGKHVGGVGEGFSGFLGGSSHYHKFCFGELTCETYEGLAKETPDSLLRCSKYGLMKLPDFYWVGWQEVHEKKRFRFIMLIGRLMVVVFDFILSLCCLSHITVGAPARSLRSNMLQSFACFISSV